MLRGLDEPWAQLLASRPVVGGKGKVKDKGKDEDKGKDKGTGKDSDKGRQKGDKGAKARAKGGCRRGPWGSGGATIVQCFAAVHIHSQSMDDY